jgi:hypothetical protein
MPSPSPRPRRKIGRQLTNLAIDILFWLAFLVAIEVNATGLVVHEWWGVGLCAFVAVHVLLHWSWVAGAVRRFWRGLRAEPRLNALVDAGLYLGFVTMIFSGLALSRSVLPVLGLQSAQTPFWLSLHIQATNVTLVLAVVHLALHWSWLVSTFRRMASAGGCWLRSVLAIDADGRRGRGAAS